MIFSTYHPSHLISLFHSSPFHSEWKVEIPMLVYKTLQDPPQPSLPAWFHLLFYLSRSALANQVFLGFFKHTRHASVSGHFHWLFCLFRTFKTFSLQISSWATFSPPSYVIFLMRSGLNPLFKLITLFPQHTHPLTVSIPWAPEHSSSSKTPYSYLFTRFIIYYLNIYSLKTGVFVSVVGCSIPFA